jgi:GAF domain-containing protein
MSTPEREGPHDPHRDAAGREPAQQGTAVALDERVEAVHRYDILDAPSDGSFDRIAQMAARIFGTPIATVSIVDEDRVWFAATQGLDGVAQVGTEPGLCASVVLQNDPYVIHDADTDPRTANHPLVRGELGLRFYAAAPIIAEGHPLGTVNVIDQDSRPQVTEVQISLLVDLAAIVAEMLQTRLAALETLRAERASHAKESDPRDPAARLAAQMGEAAAALRDRAQPEWCQLGGPSRCDKLSELKIVDSWGDSAWVCWQHAQEALDLVPTAFLATENAEGLAAYRNGFRSS